MRQLLLITAAALVTSPAFADVPPIEEYEATGSDNTMMFVGVAVVVLLVVGVAVVLKKRRDAQ